MRRHFGKSIGSQYIARTISICLGVLIFFLLLYLGVDSLKDESHKRKYFAALQKTLGPPIGSAVKRRDSEALQALFRGAIEGENLNGVRVIDKADAWEESAYKASRNRNDDALLDEQVFQFFLIDPNARSEHISVELFAPRVLRNDSEFLSVILSLTGTCFILLIASLSFYVRNSLVIPIQRLQSKIAQLNVGDLLESERLVEVRAEPADEFEELENNFLKLLRQVQIEHREALLAKNSLDYLNKNMNATIQVRQRKLEDELARSAGDSKLSALAEMASGIAHEINNPLAILIARTTQLRGLVVQFPSAAASLELIIESMEKKIFRIQESITDLETLACHPSAEESKPVKIHRMLQRLSDLATHRFTSKGLRFSLELALEAEVKVRDVELTQSLLYLIENAAEAALRSDHPWVAIQLDSEEDSGVIVRIVDSGPGIEKDIRDKIFQPFFTTKEVGKGRGVGLSLAQSIVQGNGGRLFFDFNATYTTACVLLPRHAAKSSAA